MIGIVDYNAGNIKSVERALGFLKADYILSKNPKDLENAWGFCTVKFNILKPFIKITA